MYLLNVFTALFSLTLLPLFSYSLAHLTTISLPVLCNWGEGANLIIHL